MCGTEEAISTLLHKGLDLNNVHTFLCIPYLQGLSNTNFFHFFYFFFFLVYFSQSCLCFSPTFSFILCFVNSVSSSFISTMIFAIYCNGLISFTRKAIRSASSPEGNYSEKELGRRTKICQAAVSF